MEVQIGKMILYGILSAVFYLVVPLVLFEILQAYDIMTFSATYKTAIIIFGIIGVAFSMARHLFPKNTPANKLVAFGAVVYSGIYLFYMFGGFTPGVSLGTYRIDIPGLLQVLLGLQLIAWLLLASSGIRALQYLIEALELRGEKEYSVTVRKKFKLSMLFKILGIIMSLGIAGYFGSLVYSGMNLDFNLGTFSPGIDTQGTPSPADDTLTNVTISFDVDNQGLYAIYDIKIDFYLYNISAVPAVKIGESLNNDFGTFHSFSSQLNNEVTVDIVPAILFANASTTDVEFKINFSTLYAGIFVDLNISFEFNLIP
ncbi:MAG: hypothetical protein ACFFA3_18155 [Promethearchaeota archaeon]